MKSIASSLLGSETEVYPEKLESQYRRRRICSHEPNGLSAWGPEASRHAGEGGDLHVDCCNPMFQDACFQRIYSAERFYELCCFNAFFSRLPDLDEVLDVSTGNVEDHGLFDKFDYVHTYMKSGLLYDTPAFLLAQSENALDSHLERICPPSRESRTICYMYGQIAELLRDASLRIWTEAFERHLRYLQTVRRFFVSGVQGADDITGAYAGLDSTWLLHLFDSILEKIRMIRNLDMVVAGPDEPNLSRRWFVPGLGSVAEFLWLRANDLFDITSRLTASHQMERRGSTLQIEKQEALNVASLYQNLVAYVDVFNTQAELGTSSLYEVRFGMLGLKACCSHVALLDAVVQDLLSVAQAEIRVVEVGFLLGATSKYFLDKYAGIRWLSIDKEDEEWHGTYFHEMTLDEMREMAELHSQRFSFSVFGSNKAAVSVPNGTVDVIFLDAHWKKHTLLDDLKTWYTRLSPDGVFLLRGGSHPDVFAAILEFSQWLGWRGPVDITLSGGVQSSLVLLYRPPCEFVKL
jgi:hypothetical protein